MALGDDSSCAISNTGGWHCLGYNGVGQHGDGTTTSSLTPVTPTGFSTGVIQMSHGFNNVCAIRNSAMFCAGDNTNKQVGWVAPNPSLTPQ